LNQGHAGGYNLPSRPPTLALWRSVIRWLRALPTRRQCLSCLLDIEAQARARAIAQPHAPEALGVRVDPVASDTKLVSQLLSIDQPNVRTRGHDELGNALPDGFDLLNVERYEATAARREQFDFPRYHESEM
jgi:hypothetical protein